MPDYTILLIDYDPRSVRKIRGALDGTVMRVEVAKDGEAGIEAFQRIRPDLTLVEAMIPKVHGFEVCRRLKETEHGKATPILIITAVYKGRKYRQDARHLYRCDAYIEKPISDDDLLGVVCSFLSRTEATASEMVPGEPDRIPGPIPVKREANPEV